MNNESNKLYDAIGLRLKQLRGQLGYTRIEMAARVGISPSSYGKCENGYYAPAIGTLRRLISEFEISLDWLFFNRGPMYYKDKGRNEETEKELSEVKHVMSDVQKELSEAKNEYSNLQNELELAQQKISEYEKELELKKKAEEAAVESVLAPEVQEMIDTMKQVPLLHHEILAYYYRFKTENKQLIAPPSTQGKRKLKKAAPIMD